MAGKLPQGWVETNFDSACKAIRGITFPASNKQLMKTNDNICCLRTTNVQAEVDWDNVYFVDKSYVKRTEQEIQIDDILMSMANSYELVGKISLVKTLEQNATFGAFLSTIRPLGKINSRFIYYQIKTNKIQEELRRGSSQTINIANISLKKLSDLKLLVSPLNEQKRIVAKLDQLLARVDTVCTRLISAEQTIKKFRQAVLNAAVTGRLTGITKGFLESKMEDFIISIQAGKNFKCPAKPVEKGEVGLVKISSVTYGKFDPKETKTVTDKSRINPSIFIEKGDFLITRANTIELVGACAIVKEVKHQIMLSDKVWRVKFKNIEQRFVELFLKSKYGRAEIEKRATGNQLSMRNISQKAFREIDISVPPIEEQKEIVKRVEALFALADSMEAKLKAAQNHTKKLTASILAKAFRGELVPQDSNDQPAEELLNEIAVLKAKKVKEKKQKKPAKKR